MAFLLDRPAGALDPGGGLMLAEHFQMAYATNDISAARALFAEAFGVRAFRSLEGQMPAGGHIRADLAWVGTVMYELIEASGPGSALYMDRLPVGQGFQIRHHHLGYLVQDQAGWDAVMAGAARRGWAIPYRNVNPLMAACFVDAPMLGHYLEYLFPQAAGLDFFANVPRN